MAVAGALFFSSFPPVNWWWAVVPAFALLSWVLTAPETTVAGGAGYGLVFGMAYAVPLVPWAGSFAGPLAWLGLAGLVALFTPFFGLAAVLVRQLPGWPVWFAVLWQVSEWLRSWVPFRGVPWGVVAAGQVHGPLLPLVRLGGSPLVSVLVVLLGCALTAIVRAVVARSPRAGGAAGVSLLGLAPAAAYLGVVSATAATAFVLVHPRAPADGPPVTVAAVQGSVPQLGYDFNAQRRAVLDNHVLETLQLAEDIRAGKTARPAFVVWPENSSDIDPLINPDAGRQISLAAREVGAPILVGALLMLPETPADFPGYTNTVIVWEPDTGPGERHTKQFVQPFGEYLPMPWLFSRFATHVNRFGYITAGRSTGVVHAGGVAVGVGSCWEVTFDRALRQSVHNGAQVLAVPANAATFGQMMSEQELAFAKVRAVELDRYVVVASTTGVSAVIAPDGHELQRTGYFTPAYLVAEVQLRDSLTPAARWGELQQRVLVGTGVAVLVFAAVGRRRRRHRPAAAVQATVATVHDTTTPEVAGSSRS